MDFLTFRVFAQLEYLISAEKERTGLLPASHNELITDKAVAEAQASTEHKHLDAASNAVQ